MKNITRLGVATLLLIASYSCKGIKDSNYIRIGNAKIFDWKQFPTYSLTETVLIEEIENSDPYNLSLIDTLLFLSDPMGKNLLLTYSIPSKRLIGRFGYKGRGPNELLSMEHVHEGLKKGTAAGYDVSLGRWLQFKVAESLERGSFVVDSLVDIPSERDKYYLDNPSWVSDQTFAATGFLDFESRCFITNLRLDSYTEFFNPDITFYKQLPDNILADMFSSHLSVKPDKSRLILAGRYIDLVEIFNVDGTHTVTGIGPILDLDIEIDMSRSSERQVFVKTDKTRRAFLSVKSTDEYIYLLYSGKQKQDSSHYSSGNNVYVVDWNGNPIAHLTFDTSIWDIEIDKDNKAMYGIAPLPLPSLIKYDLDIP
jgi:hypothetical protein